MSSQIKPAAAPAGGQTAQGVVNPPNNLNAPDPLLAPNQTVPVRQSNQTGTTGAQDNQSDFETKYRELLPAYTEATQELALLKHTLQASALPHTQTPTAPATQVDGGDDVERYVGGVVDKKVQPIDGKIAQLQFLLNRMTVQSEHPELRDPNFKKELNEFLNAIPVAVRMRVEPTLEGATWVVDLFKKFKASAPATSQATIPVMEQGGARNVSQATGPVYSRAKISELRKTNLEEYKRRQPEILLAYQEGRVID